MPSRVTTTSGGMFLPVLAICSNCVVTERIRASASSGWTGERGRRSNRTWKYGSVWSHSATRTRSLPSSMTRTEPSGTFRIWMISATMPISCRSSVSGSSVATCFWAVRMMCSLPAMASSSARTDFSRPTNSGKMMPGKWTISRMGRRGRTSGNAPGWGASGLERRPLVFLARGAVVVVRAISGWGTFAGEPNPGAARRPFPVREG